MLLSVIQKKSLTLGFRGVDSGPRRSEMPPYGECSANKRHRCYTQAHFLRRAHPAAVAPRHIQLQISVLLPPLRLEKHKNARRCLIFLWASSHTSAFPNSQSRAPHPQCTDSAVPARLLGARSERRGTGTLQAGRHSRDLHSTDFPEQ